MNELPCEIAADHQRSVIGGEHCVIIQIILFGPCSILVPMVDNQHTAYQYFGFSYVSAAFQISFTVDNS